jgi:hypothetical protein
MDLLAQARKDAKTFLTGGFSTGITFDNNVLSATVQGIAFKHHLSIEEGTGAPVNSKNTEASVSEQALLDAGFITRNANNEIDMKGWKVTYTDSAGISAKYLIDESRPDEGLGIIVLVLGDSDV